MDTERLVAAAAVLGMRSDLGLAARLAEIDADARPDRGRGRAAAHPRRRGHGASVTFTHQLVRSAVYHD